MYRLYWSSLVAMLSLVVPAGADSAALVLELEGTLSKGKSEAPFVLSVEGERDWTLHLPGWRLSAAREMLKKSRSRKVFVIGTVPIRTVGGTIQLRDRTVRVQMMVPMVPAVKITEVVKFSPAAGSLQVDDILLEIGEPKKLTEITDWSHCKRLLAEHQGKKINIVVERGGRAKLIDGVALRKGEAPLGIFAATVWRRMDASGGLDTNPTPGDLPAKRTADDKAKFDELMAWYKGDYKGADKQAKIDETPGFYNNLDEVTNKDWRDFYTDEIKNKPKK